MSFRAITLFVVTILAGFYVAAMMYGQLTTFPYGLIGLVLPFVLGYLFYWVLRENADAESDDRFGPNNED
jgi:high-affinity Fe2+/Pb2+ permease